MAAIHYKEITSSPPFTFVVGPDENEHTIHSALVAHQSPALNALINGGMKESIERRVIWKEISEEVFIAFSQYVYTGDYEGATPRKREVPGEVAPIRVSPVGKAGWVPPHVRKKGGSESSSGTKKRLLWHKFQALDPLPSRAFSPIFWSSADYEYTDVFLSHVRMYVFADYYGIDPLQTLALHNLLRTLIQFDNEGGSYGDIIPLVRYSFEQTADKGGQVDKLRSLICSYTACKVEDLWKDTEFRDLTKTLPDFSTGIITAMLDRLD